MTPLIDIIFLLLLFFMLTSTFTRFAEVPLVQAGSGAADAPSQEPRIFLRLTAEGVTLNGRTPPGTLGDALGGEGGLVFLSVGEGVSSQHFIDVLTTLQALPAVAVTVIR